MPKREISNLDLKIKLTKEYLDNGGYQKIWDKGLLEDLLLVKSGRDGKVNPDTVSTRVNAFMLTILASQLTPPFYSPNRISEYETTLQKSNSFDQENIDTVEQFDKIYKEFKDKTDSLFRGQREAKWRLYSKLQRHWIIDKLNGKFENYQTLLEKLVEFGRKQYNEKYIELLGEKHDENTFSINNSKNIQKQAGVFTWNANTTKPFEMVVNEQNNEATKDKGA